MNRCLKPCSAKSCKILQNLSEIEEENIEYIVRFVLLKLLKDLRFCIIFLDALPEIYYLPLSVIRKNFSLSGLSKFAFIIVLHTEIIL